MDSNNALIDEILSRADIVQVISSYIPVIKKGRSYVAVCPFHDDKNPSMNISPEKRIFKCFACGTGGNAISFVQKYEKIPFPEAAIKVGELSGFGPDRLASLSSRKKRVDKDKEPLYKCIEDLGAYYAYSLMTEEGEKARSYLAKRNIPAEQWEKYGIGYAPLDGNKTIEYLKAKGHSIHSIEGIGVAFAKLEGMRDSNAGRLIFPLHDPEGRIVAFSARRLTNDDNGPKYVNSPETPIFKKGLTIYNYERAKVESRRLGHVYLFEGFMDVMALDRAKLPNGMALMGTALTNEQAELLKALGAEVRLSLDGDDAGQEGMMKAISILRRAHVPFRIVLNPNDKRDPDDILQEEGPEGLKRVLDHLVDPFEFQLGYYLHVKKPETSSDRKKVVAHFLPIIKGMKEGLEREDYVAKLAQATSFEVSAIKSALNAYRPAREGEEGKSSSHNDQRRTDSKMEKRLKKAETAFLHYMLHQGEAISYYESNIGCFYDSVLNEIANFLLDYVTERGNKEVELPLLISDIERSEVERRDELVGETTAIFEKRGLPPYSLAELDNCWTAIREEKGKLANAIKAKETLGELANESEKAKVLDSLMDEKRRAFREARAGKRRK